ncbi:Callose synthase 5 [Auxenochlorella protothecoides]|uniref:1,3-beta-glucan synthase n=2 Tax=Auxenochlorella protothecoides TaxID=3075 RepID=V5NFZ2_AUXPR|nr:Callose synthase 5 [Auxenochlorella protothecoides]AHA86554.1 glucan synthase [Auxenochlorella protothecoides]KFM22655.1 Callose synthase 5 [Auxenochlorella protothecoides]
MDRFARAVHRLHAAIFQGYRDWCSHVGLPLRIPELKLAKIHRPHTIQARWKILHRVTVVSEWEYGLEELAMYFLVYSEAANLRHTPECLWFVFWICRNSFHRWNGASCPNPMHPSSPIFAYEHLKHADVIQRNISLRNRHHAELMAAMAALGTTPDLVDETRESMALTALVHTGSIQPDSPDGAALADMAAHGDAGYFLDRVVSPIFAFLAVHVDRMGTDGVEIAHRIAYDDVNESLCRRNIVAQALLRLGVRVGPGGSIAMSRDPYDALLGIGRVQISVEGQPIAKLAAGRLDTEGMGGVGWNVEVARDWWGAFVFRKTFVERRSIFTMYRAFYRVWAFILLEFHLMAVLTWGRDNYYAISSLAMSHALLSFLEQVAAFWTQRASVGGPRVAGGAISGRAALGVLQWLAILCVMALLMAAQVIGWWVFGEYHIWWWAAAGYGGLVVAQALLSTRPGHAVSWGTWLSNVVFWALVLGMKGAFDWYAVFRTLDTSILGLWNRGWLPLSSDGRLDGDLVLCIARALPALVIMATDAQVFYYLVTALFGWVKGLVQLNLGAVTGFQEVVATFHKAPAQCWVLFSDVWNEVVAELREVDLISNAERDNLVFVHLDLEPGVEAVSRALEVPGINSAQKVGREVGGGGVGRRARACWWGAECPAGGAWGRMRILIVWLVLQLRIVDREQSNVLLDFKPLEGPLDLEQRTARRSAVAAVGELLKLLKTIMAKAPDDAALRTRWEASQKMHGCLVKLAAALRIEIKAVLRVHSRSARGPDEKDSSRRTHSAAVALDRALDALSAGLLDFWRWCEFVGEAAGLATLHADAPDSAARRCVAAVARQLERMLDTSAKGAQPRGDEALRVLTGFMSSLRNPTLARPPAVEDMLSWNVLTPHYEEDVMYALNAASVARHFDLQPSAATGMADLVRENEDGLSVMQWLKSAYAREWDHLLERLGPALNGLEPRHITAADFDVGGPLHAVQVQLLLWASYRGQLLARTVRGMMAYERGLALVARLESPRPPRLSEVAYEARLKDLVSSKFTYVYPGLRVATIDSAVAEGGARQCAVLVRANVGTVVTDPRSVHELIRLPQNRETTHGVILGEGKPENQNSAIIFCFGEVLQAIDMNQDNYLAEALKTPVTPHGTINKYERPFPDMGHSPVVLVGFREWVFSQDSGALASFAAATEFSFGSVVQRVMTWPGAVRFHYGHPDMWNKLFVMTRGGVSKATRGFHISEDVFAGYNHTLRGGKTKFKEYISVGKGRDMGFDSINSFESKVSGGNGEQAMSRDLFRMCSRFDFFRLMAFYHSGTGFFINSFLIMTLVYLNIWVILVLALTNSMLVVDPYTLTVINALTGQAVAVSVNQAVQLGMLSIIVFAVELLLEYGIVKMLGTLLVQFVQGSLAFFTFRARTSAYYFMSDVQYGGAKYIPTGRGYAIKHSSFVKVYSSYARSHLYFAAELVYLLVLLALIDTTASPGGGASLPLAMQDYGALTWSTWLVAVCILWSPFWFNPQTFQLERCKDDFEAWILWMTDVIDSEAGSTWYSWNKSNLERIRNEKMSLNNPMATSLRGIAGALPTAVLALAAISTLTNTSINRWVIFGIASGGFWTFILVVWVVRRVLLSNYYYRLWRAMRTFCFLAAIAFLVCCVIFIPGGFSAGVGVKNLIIIIFANMSAVSVATQILLYGCRDSIMARHIVDASYRTLDWILGYIFFSFLFLLSFIQVVDMLQGAMLYNMKFAKALQRSRLMESNFLPSYVDRAMERLSHTLQEEIVVKTPPRPKPTKGI